MCRASEYICMCVAQSNGVALRLRAVCASTHCSGTRLSQTYQPIAIIRQLGVVSLM
jgi:hypothetical protein